MAGIDLVAAETLRVDLPQPWRGRCAMQPAGASVVDETLVAHPSRWGCRFDVYAPDPSPSPAFASRLRMAFGSAGLTR